MNFPSCISLAQLFGWKSGFREGKTTCYCLGGRWPWGEILVSSIVSLLWTSLVIFALNYIKGIHICKASVVKVTYHNITLILICKYKMSLEGRKNPLQRRRFFMGAKSNKQFFDSKMFLKCWLVNGVHVQFQVFL